MRINQDPAALAVSTDFPGNTIAEFAAWAKDKKSVTIANSGIGSAFHLASAELAEKLGIQVQHIPFGGASPAITALLGGHVDAVVVGPGEMRIQHEAGQVKILGVMSEERVALFPGCPNPSRIRNGYCDGNVEGACGPEKYARDNPQKTDGCVFRGDGVP